MLGGYHVPPGAEIIPFHFVMANSPDHVADPTQFLPERWLKDHERFERLHPFAVLPFGHGPRMCVGRRFAEQELHVFLAKMVRHFRIGWRHGDLPMKTETIAFPAKPLRFTFADR